MTGAVNFDWTDDRVAALVKLVDREKTSSEIAAEIGHGLTRNAIIGKLSRLGLKLRGLPGRRSQGGTKRWTVDEKTRVVVMVTEEKKLVPEIAHAIGVSEESVREQIKAARKAGRLSATALADNHEARRVEFALKREKAKRDAAPKAVALPKRTAPAVTRVVAAPRPQPASVAAEPRTAPIDLAARRLPKVVGDVFTAPDDAYLVTIHELRPVGPFSDCRWPYKCDDGQTRYCGKPATDGSWCCEHARLAYAGDARPTMKAYGPVKNGRGLAMQREARR